MKSEELKKLAELARLALSDEELASFGTDLSAILDFVSELNELNTDDVPITHQITGLRNVLREDAITRDHTFKKKLLESAPKTDGDFVSVRAVLEERGDK